MAHSVEILLPAQRYVFALDEHGNAEPQPASTSAEGFLTYKRLQPEGRVAGMIAIPNCCLIRAGEDYVVDPGVIMQGAPVTGALRKRGIEPHDTKVILTHTHFDHVQALIEFTQRETYVHEIELEAPYTAIEQNKLDMVRVEKLTGEEGEIEPGVRWIRTPGPFERADLAAGRHRRRTGRDRLRLRRPAARVLREARPARGLRPRARGAAAAVGADQGARPARGDPRAQPAGRPQLRQQAARRRIPSFG